MGLIDKQHKFLQMLSKLIIVADQMGYQITPACSRCALKGHHMKNSLHYVGLAADLNLFKNGKYLTETSDHKPLGLIWESWGGFWGGRFGESTPGAGDGSDGNHYSLEHNGRR